MRAEYVSHPYQALPVLAPSELTLVGTASGLVVANVQSTEPTLQVSALCGQQMVVQDKANGRSVTVIVEELCAECAPTDIMLGSAAFDELAGGDNGVDAIDGERCHDFDVR